MAHKKPNKRKQLRSKEKEAIPHPNSWPNLPHQLLGLIARKPSLVHNITSFGCVIKLWRSPSKHCNSSRWPQLVEIRENERGDYHKNARSHKIKLKFSEEENFSWYYKRKPFKERYPAIYLKGDSHEKVEVVYYKQGYYEKWHYPGLHFKGHSHGQVVVLGYEFSSLYLWEPAKRCTRSLPPWDTNLPFRLAMLSSEPEDRIRCSVMVITGDSSPAFAFYRLYKGQNEWSVEDCAIKDPYNPSQNMEFYNAIGFQGKFYALSLQGSLVVIEDVDNSCFRITGVGASRAVPSKVSRQFREYLVECDGEILLVFLISRRSIDVVEDVEVFRLDVSRLLWVKVENLEGRALFLEDECCMWVNARQVGCRNNCIYFTHHRVKNEWFLYEMGIGHISPAFGDDVRWDEQITE